LFINYDTKPKIGKTISAHTESIKF